MVKLKVIGQESYTDEAGNQMRKITVVVSFNDIPQENRDFSFPADFSPEQIKAELENIATQLYQSKKAESEQAEKESAEAQFNALLDFEVSASESEETATETPSEQPAEAQTTEQPAEDVTAETPVDSNQPA